jgi:hypothetical protein
MDLWKPNEKEREQAVMKDRKNTFFLNVGKERLGPFYSFMEAIKESRRFPRMSSKIEHHETEEELVILRSYEPAI